LKVSLLARLIHDALGRWLPRASPLIAVGANSRTGLPVRSVIQALSGAALYPTDRLGTVERIDTASHFTLPH
jgi:hypothetical protein